ncbi:MAG: MBL fold metallo-hydrolase [Syntrophomonadaceae bacterium]|nr:MBL fold metallo-hydrolase [Syntrophomonadaceae bacterium]
MVLSNEVGKIRYTSGDGGYDAHFRENGEKYGPFNIALIEGGQYDPHWPWGHMAPEQAMQANLDVNSKEMMLMHWGTFTLVFHSWTDSIERSLKEAKRAGINLIAPKIGETFILGPGLSNPPFARWNLN